MDRPDLNCHHPARVLTLLKRALFLVTLLLLAGSLHAAQPDERVCTLDQAGYLLLGADGEPMTACRPDEPLIPASTLKILTAWLALDHWGPDFRFSTDFYLDNDLLLWVRGSGDPMLVSEEVTLMAQALKARNLMKISGIGVDTRYYADSIEIPGRAASDNPYDAPVAALAVNFNTVYVSRRHGTLQSAEAQTPLTATARRLAKRIKGVKQRINLRNAADSGVYFAEILRQKLRETGISVGEVIQQAVVPAGARHLYRHENSKTLTEVIRAMLKYSTNFIANQLFLNLGAEAFKPPATMEKAVRYATQRVDEAFGWRRFRMVEGAGLSRKNRLSARQLTELLQLFRPWKQLLPERRAGIKAKTGTLNGIRTLAGYLETSEQDRPFAILINSPAPRRLRHELVEQWSKQLPGR